MRKEYTWEIKVKNTPLLKKKCSHCDCERFYCSEKFRMNSQKRNIDVWLIYRCVKCDNTYNMTILSRTKPELINRGLFCKFSNNETITSWKYAFSAETARKNNVELDYSSVEYEIELGNFSVEDILNGDDVITVFKIKTYFEFGLKLASVIRMCLNLSSNQLSRIIEAQAIFMAESHSLKKYKVKDGDIVFINKCKLKDALRI